MEPPPSTSEVPAPNPARPWLVPAMLLTGGLFMFVWLFQIGRKTLAYKDRQTLYLLPLMGALWVLGGVFMALGLIAPTSPGSSGNPQFLAGFLAGIVALVLITWFANKSVRPLSSLIDYPLSRKQSTRAAFLSAGVLLTQLMNEASPLHPDTSLILTLFQILATAMAIALATKWIEAVDGATRLYAKQTPLTTPAPATAVVDAQAIR